MQLIWAFVFTCKDFLMIRSYVYYIEAHYCLVQAYYMNCIHAYYLWFLAYSNYFEVVLFSCCFQFLSIQKEPSSKLTSIILPH